ncbi:dolichyl-phosphate-mannose--protein mannosyltransferase [Actinomadura sp. 9N407]|uniref:dolichyl-phosphate-mannose--protein mannosyltransferase n=1 Tax=Actinomadura sp. 9N407 TaxID=3375154 RepID=UPI0037A76191
MTTTVTAGEREARACVPSMRDRLAALPWGWLGPLLVSAVAGLVVFHRLGSPHAIIWDETYYAKDGWSLLRYGVERNWNVDAEGRPANMFFLAGNPEAGLGRGGLWSAHPPVGKWLIAAGIAVFGADPFGFRFAAGAAGVLAVLILARTARRMTGSTPLGCAAGLLLALDGVWLVSSRTAMLDIFLLLWTLAGFACLVVDRDRTRTGLTARLDGAGLGGPFLWHRWRIGAAVFFGLACATKWSGIYVLAAFWLLALVWDLNARKDAGVARPWRGMLKLDLLPSFAQVWAVAAIVYLAGWWGWFASGTGLQQAMFGRSLPGFQRYWADQHASDIWPTFLNPLRSLWHYHAMTLEFHSGVRSGNPAQSWPWDWPLLSKPAVMYRGDPALGQDGCDAARCVSQVVDLGNPAIWWLSTAALLALLAIAPLVRDWRIAAVAVGYLATWLPWFPAAFDDRTMYSTYSLQMLPFAVLAIVLLYQRIIERYGTAPSARAALAAGGLAYLLVAAVILRYFYPILSAEVISEPAWQARMWFHGWK